MRSLFRIRLISLLLLTTAVSMASFYYTVHDYTHTTYRYVMQVPPATPRTPLGPLNGRASYPRGAIVSFTPVRMAETNIDWGQIRKDILAIGAGVAVVFAIVVRINRGSSRTPLRNELGAIDRDAAARRSLTKSHRSSRGS
jgi:hypothetical protein